MKLIRKSNEHVFSDVISFGQYKEATIEQIYHEDSQYLKWCMENISWFKIKEPFKQMVLDKAKKEEAEQEEIDGCGGFDPRWDFDDEE